MASREDSSADACPNCDYYPSYTGGYCFKCGCFRPSKRAAAADGGELDVAEFMQRGFATRLDELPTTEEQVDEKQSLQALRYAHRAKSVVRWKPVHITVENSAEASVIVQAVLEKYGNTDEGELVRAIAPAWEAIANALQRDWSQAMNIPLRMWEEMIAATFDRAGYDEVILTQRSGDFGRDVIAVRRGVCCVRIIGSVKAYKPGHLVKHDDVRALAGVLLGDQRATKGIITTTSDFAPTIAKDPFIAPLIP